MGAGGAGSVNPWYQSPPCNAGVVVVAGASVAEFVVVVVDINVDVGIQGPLGNSGVAGGATAVISLAAEFVIGPGTEFEAEAHSPPGSAGVVAAVVAIAAGLGDEPGIDVGVGSIGVVIGLYQKTLGSCAQDPSWTYVLAPIPAS